MVWGRGEGGGREGWWWLGEGEGERVCVRRGVACVVKKKRRKENIGRGGRREEGRDVAAR